MLPDPIPVPLPAYPLSDEMPVPVPEEHNPYDPLLRPNAITNNKSPLGVKELMPRVILHTEVGSTVHGVNLPGQDDRDELAVVIPPKELVLGCGTPHFEHYVYRTQPEGKRSGPGDLDLTFYSLQKATRLLLAANPTMLLLLFTPNETCSTLTYEGATFRKQLPTLIASKRAATSFQGYIQTQVERLTGRRGQMRVSRPELVEAHGYDTKYAGHIVRLAYQGIEYLRTGRYTVPMRERHRAEILAIRRGEVSFGDTLELIADLMSRLRYEEEMTDLPDEPDIPGVNKLLKEIYLSAWNIYEYDD